MFSYEPAEERAEERMDLSPKITYDELRSLLKMDL
jgi:hypothetical protein